MKTEASTAASDSFPASTVSIDSALAVPSKSIRPPGNFALEFAACGRSARETRSRRRRQAAHRQPSPSPPPGTVRWPSPPPRHRSIPSASIVLPLRWSVWTTEPWTISTRPIAGPRSSSFLSVIFERAPSSAGRRFRLRERSAACAGGRLSTTNRPTRSPRHEKTDVRPFCLGHRRLACVGIAAQPNSDVHRCVAEAAARRDRASNSDLTAQLLLAAAVITIGLKISPSTSHGSDAAIPTSAAGIETSHRSARRHDRLHGHSPPLE